MRNLWKDSSATDKPSLCPGEAFVKRTSSAAALLRRHERQDAIPRQAVKLSIAERQPGNRLLAGGGSCARR
jgi:hypothetical protein